LKRYENRRILAFTDLHLPYQHPEAINFLYQVKKRFKPDRVVCTGDIVDGYNANQYLKDPNHDHTAHQELQAVLEEIELLGQVFPDMLLCMGNHDARHGSAATRAGLASHYLKPFKKVFGMPKGWKVSDTHTLTVGNNDRTKIMFKHYSGANSLTEAERAGVCYAQGHAHKKCNIQWSSNGKRLIWGMNIPSLISDTGCPYKYDKLSNHRPVRGCSMIIDGIPQIIPLGRVGW
jgi:predicted phosphodiesterase